jgi:predicted metalloprotease with PDZ domain
LAFERCDESVPRRILPPTAAKEHAMSIHRNLFLSLLLPATFAIARFAHAAPAIDAATYRIRVLSLQPLRLGVSATLPPTSKLSMSTTRPGDIEALDRRGWPAMVEHLQVHATDGHALAVHDDGDSGWTLDTPSPAPVRVDYEVDASVLAVAGWPAPRESIHVDPDHLVVAGRAVFVTADGQGASRIEVEPPPGWHVAAPWAPVRGGFRAAGVDDLEDNLLGLSREVPLRVHAGRFDVSVVPIGWDAPALSALRRVVAAVAPRYARSMPPAAGSNYVAVMLPQREHGGESFRNSFAMNVEQSPTPAGIGDWGNTVAHEIFHYWNGWRLTGRDYASTQWFQEGFTEYTANRALLQAGLIHGDGFLRLLSKHLQDARRLQTPLDAPGTHKGPPLYGAGALVAFCWDVELASRKRGIEALFTELWQRTRKGAEPYDWATIRASLQALDASKDWQSVHDRYIAGREPPPLLDALRTLGLRLDPSAPADAPRIEFDPAADATAKARWRRFAR